MSSVDLRERHIDRLLSEELEASSAFAAWFVRQVFGDQVPQDAPSSCATLIGHHRIVGETDILVKVGWRSGVRAEIHIEDKLEALPQPDQALRYATAVEKSETRLAASALVAPRPWMRRHPRETALYHAAIALEDIAKQLGARAAEVEQHASLQALELAKRLRWRAALLNGSTHRWTVYRAIQAGELTDWNRAAAEVIAAANGLVLTVSQRQRSEGRNKASRAFQFGEALSPDHHGRTPALKLRTANVKHPGRVSLEVRAVYDDSSLRTKATDAGFATFVTNTGTLLISTTTQHLRELTIAKSVAEQIRHLEDAADVAQKLIEWWENQRGASVLLPPFQPVE
jgi:hypothetical protein